MDLQMTGIIDKQLIDGFDCVFGCSHRLILGFRISGFRKNACIKLAKQSWTSVEEILHWDG